MSDQAPEAGAPPTAPADSASATGDVPAGGTGQLATDEASGQLDSTIARKTAASFRAGKTEGQAELLADLGVSSLEDIRRVLDLHRSEGDTPAEPEHVSTAPEDTSTIRKLQAELRSRDRTIEEHSSTLQRLATLNDSARQRELHNRLASAGAHPDALSDLVSLLAERVEWSEDGQGLEVVERQDGKVIPSGATLDELIAEQRERRSYMFVAPGSRGGTGTTVRTAPVPSNGTPARRETWRDRIVKARSG